jgi:anti-sigma factor RsiW
MNCEELSLEWLSYMDGRITPAQRSRIESHSRECAECRRRAAEYHGLWSALEEVPAMEPSLAFNARVRARIAAEQRPHFWDWLMPSPRLAFALALLMALSVWFARVPADVTTAQSDEEFRMIRDMRVLENYDVLEDFSALSELPSAQPAAQPVAAPVSGQARM